MSLLLIVVASLIHLLLISPIFACFASKSLPNFSSPLFFSTDQIRAAWGHPVTLVPRPGTAKMMLDQSRSAWGCPVVLVLQSDAAAMPPRVFLMQSLLPRVCHRHGPVKFQFLAWVLVSPSFDQKCMGTSRHSGSETSKIVKWSLSFWRGGNEQKMIENRHDATKEGKQISTSIQCKRRGVDSEK